MAKIQRQKATFSFTTAYGIPAISTESPVKLQGFKQQIDALSWIQLRQHIVILRVD